MAHCQSRRGLRKEIEEESRGVSEEQRVTGGKEIEKRKVQNTKYKNTKEDEKVIRVVPAREERESKKKSPECISQHVVTKCK